MLNPARSARQTSDGFSPLHTLERTLLEHVRQNRPAWSPEVRLALCTLELAEANHGLAHVVLKSESRA
jgi:hypothetical protein